MPEENVKQQPTVVIEAVANIKNFSTIPNSNSEFCVYTYKAEFETMDQINRPGFFNSAFSFLNVGDIIRLFRFDLNKVLTHYYQYVVVSVDKINKKVKVATLENVKIENRIIE